MRSIKLESVLKLEFGIKQPNKLAAVEDEPMPQPEPEEDLTQRWCVPSPLSDAVGDGDMSGFTVALLRLASDLMQPPRHPLDPVDCPGYYLVMRMSLEQQPAAPWRPSTVVKEQVESGPLQQPSPEEGCVIYLYVDN